MIDSSCLLPALVVFSLLFGLHARIDVYRAFVCGAKEGLLTLLEMAPYLCAILTATSLLRGTGVLDAMEDALNEKQNEADEYDPETDENRYATWWE